MYGGNVDEIANEVTPIEREALLSVDKEIPQIPSFTLQLQHFLFFQL